MMRKKLFCIFLEEERQIQRSQKLTKDDVTNQGRLLLNEFIHDRMIRDGIVTAPAVTDLQEPGTPCGK